MFEKKAEEYADSVEGYDIKTYSISDIEQAFIAGVNKANEWHYPSKGELPKEDTAEKETLYLLWFGLDDSDCMTGLFSQGRFWCYFLPVFFLS